MKRKPHNELCQKNKEAKEIEVTGSTSKDKDYEYGYEESKFFLNTVDNNNNTNEILRIEHDGTVVVSQYGKEKQAAEMFYEALQIEGKTLHQKIAKLQKERDIAVEALEWITHCGYVQSTKHVQMAVKALAKIRETE